MAPFDSLLRFATKLTHGKPRGIFPSESNDPEEALHSKADRRAYEVVFDATLFFMESSWYVYIAQASTGRYYTGITTDPRRRIDEHNRGEGSKMAYDQGKFELVYTSSPFVSQSEARDREIQIKGWSRIKKEKLINGEWK